jgi:arylsulfatase
MKALKETGVEDNTLFIFTSDNGPWLSYGGHSGSALPLREGKGTVWEGGVRVPFVAKWPKGLPQGKEIHEPAMTIDLLPTIARIAGADLPALPIDGKDILHILRNEKGARSPHEAYYFYYHTNELQALRSGKWKLYLPHSYRTLNGRTGSNDGMYINYESKTLTEMELYDLEKDISELHNVAAKNPEIVQRLMLLAEKAREDMGDSLTKRSGKNTRPPGRVD